jgi:hypothetical protein
MYGGRFTTLVDHSRLLCCCLPTCLRPRMVSRETHQPFTEDTEKSDLVGRTKIIPEFYGLMGRSWKILWSMIAILAEGHVSLGPADKKIMRMQLQLYSSTKSTCTWLPILEDCIRYSLRTRVLEYSGSPERSRVLFLRICQKSVHSSQRPENWE